METDLYLRLTAPESTKIAMLIMDGLGGLPRQPDGLTELETAPTPNLDALAGISTLGLTIPVGPGITAGSGPGHLSIFGYNPNIYDIGRGMLEALGVGFEPGPEDVAARGNFCTLDENGLVTDRRAGRLPTAQAMELADLLQGILLKDVEHEVRVVKEHRFALVFHGQGLDEDVSGTDPLVTGTAPLAARALSPSSEKTAAAANQFIAEANRILAGCRPANSVMLRGFARCPVIPGFLERYKLRAAAVAVNGMYRGVARLVGMDILPVDGTSIQAEFTALEKHWPEYDFFYLHVKQTDTAGEKGDFDGKAAIIAEVDALIPRLTALSPDVLIVTGDHSTPAVMQAHSWHPVPLLLHGKNCRPDGITQFGERACARGSLGTIPAWQVMPMALAHTGRIGKYGA